MTGEKGSVMDKERMKLAIFLTVFLSIIMLAVSIKPWPNKNDPEVDQPTQEIESPVSDGESQIEQGQ